MNRQNKVVLIIENDDEMIRLLRLVFRRHNLEFVAAVSGEEGLNTAQSVKPDLVLLDIMLPGMDGWEVYQRMKARTRLQAIPVIIVSVMSREMAPLYGHSFDTVAGYVLKPFHPRSLITLVEDCLELATREDEWREESEHPAHGTLRNNEFGVNRQKQRGKYVEEDHGIHDNAGADAQPDADRTY